MALGKFCPHGEEDFPPPVGTLGQVTPDLSSAAGIRTALAENGYLPSRLCNEKLSPSLSTLNSSVCVCSPSLGGEDVADKEFPFFCPCLLKVPEHLPSFGQEYKYIYFKVIYKEKEFLPVF